MDGSSLSSTLLQISSGTRLLLSGSHGGGDLVGVRVATVDVLSDSAEVGGVLVRGVHAQDCHALDGPGEIDDDAVDLAPGFSGWHQAGGEVGRHGDDVGREG